MFQINILPDRKAGYYLACIAILCLLSGTISSQRTSLSFDDEIQEDVFVIEFNVSDRDAKAVKEDLDFDVEFKNPEILISGSSYKVKSITTRGKSSLKQQRKSYTVKLEDNAIVQFKSGDRELKNFYLISMSMDRNYVHNRFAFDCLNALGIFPLSHRYIALKINDHDEGIYLLTERPFDFLIDEIGAPYALRRLRSGAIDKDKLADGLPSSDLKKYRKHFKQILNSIKETEGSESFAILDAQIDMEAYMRWLAFNYIVRNGDYTDEVYYYILPNSDAMRFGIMSWDFDDILAREPHEGKAAREHSYKDKLLFSLEDPLDRKIVGDTTLYAQYLNELQSVIDILSENQLKTILENIYADLLPYFRQSNIVSQSQLDAFGETNENELREYLQKLYDYVRNRENKVLTHY